MQLATADIQSYRQQLVALDNIEYSAGNTKSVKLPIDNPTDHIRCTLSYNWASSGGTLKSGKGLNLVRWLTLRVAGSTNVIRIPGKAVQHVHNEYYGAYPYAAHPGVTSTGKAVYQFDIPVNAATHANGGAEFASLLDLSGTSGHLEIDWGSASDIWSAGTNSISNVEFKVRVMQSAVIGTGIPGGVGYGKYLLHMITTDEQSITATNSNMRMDMIENHVINKIMIMTDTDGVATDSILNSVSIRVGESSYQKWTAEEIQHYNYSRYKLSQLETGLYVIDMAQTGLWAQMLAFSTAQRFRIELDVTKPGSGTAHRAYVMTDRFLRP